MEAAVKAKTKVLLVGGMDYNVPPQIKEHFDVVRHITQGTKFQTLPRADYVFVITEWANHNMMENVKAQTDAPIIPLARGGWEAVKKDLVRRSIFLEEAPVEPLVEKQEKPASESLFSSMSEAEVWKKYGQSIIQAAQGALKPREILSEEDVLEALSLSGVPKEDCRVYLPKLQMKGILDPVEGGKWRLMAAMGTDFENDRVKVDSEEAQKEEAARSRRKPVDKSVVERAVPASNSRGSWGIDQATGRRQVRSPELLSMIAGLSKGPYASKRAIFDEMRKYTAFDALSDWQVGKYIDRAIEAKIIDDTRLELYINHDPSISLARVKVQEREPEAPEKLMAAAAPTPLQKMAQEHASKAENKIGRTEAEKAWCYVVEGVKKERERLGGVLSHCRIEWMGDNKVLVIFIPPALAQWQKFVESTENWGLVTRMIQERLSRDTAIRFMVDNGLRA